jgi:hypothetical protein
VRFNTLFSSQGVTVRTCTCFLRWRQPASKHSFRRSTSIRFSFKLKKNCFFFFPRADRRKQNEAFDFFGLHNKTTNKSSYDLGSVTTPNQHLQWAPNLPRVGLSGANPTTSEFTTTTPAL